MHKNQLLHNIKVQNPLLLTSWNDLGMALSNGNIVSLFVPVS